MAQPSQDFFDQARATSYDEQFARLAPLRDALHLLTALVLEEQPADAHVLCVGAGTGAELLALARMHPHWIFTAVDPSGPMLAICRQRAAEAGIADRCRFHEGYVSDLPTEARFDAATSLLVSQFLTDRPTRVSFYRDIRLRLNPNGLLVSADLSTGPAPNLREQNLVSIWRRMMRFSGVPPDKLDMMCDALERHVAVVPAAEVAAVIVEAGFARPALFFQSLLIHGWFAQREA